jgi:hypothetical protein
MFIRGVGLAESFLFIGKNGGRRVICVSTVDDRVRFVRGFGAYLELRFPNP